jgi:hypothetical protein
MRDRDIRSALHAQLWAEHQDDDTTLILDELGLCQGAVRADVAVINGSLAGFEIKSDRDTLARLPNQVEIYGRVFDYVTLIVGATHAGEIHKAIPAFWGIVVATEGDGVLVLRSRRSAKRNRNVDPLAVVRLLWRDEALALLTQYDLNGGLQSKPRRQLWDALVAELPPDELAAAVREALRARAGWRSDRSPSRCGGSSRSTATS